VTNLNTDPRERAFDALDHANDTAKERRHDQRQSIPVLRDVETPARIVAVELMTLFDRLVLLGYSQTTLFEDMAPGATATLRAWARSERTRRSRGDPVGRVTTVASVMGRYPGPCINVQRKTTLPRPPRKWRPRSKDGEEVITAENITDEQISEFRDSLPEVTDEEFASGGRPFSPARWRRVCRAALGASNASSERGFIAAEINRRADAAISDLIAERDHFAAECKRLKAERTRSLGRRDTTEG